MLIVMIGQGKKVKKKNAPWLMRVYLKNPNGATHVTNAVPSTAKSAKNS
jgi:hypothetical protein